MLREVIIHMDFVVVFVCLFLLFTKITLIATLFSLALTPTISFERFFFVIWGVLDKVIAVSISMTFFVCF